MNAPRYLLLLALLLSACAGKPVLTSTLPATPVPRSSMVGVPIPALLPGTAGAVAVQQKAELERRLQNTVARVQISALPDDTLGLVIAAADSFEAGSAQMKPSILTSYAEIAEVLRTFPSSILHVVVYHDAPATEDAALSLGARRAASILDYLERRGLPPTRLRAEGRSQAGTGERVELLLKPVLQSREAWAWTPPS